MCGIIGWLSFSETFEAPRFEKALEALAHRGPDAAHIVSRGPIALGHRRLSIIDLSAAADQPMADHTGRYWIVFNGEIYNFQELRAQLLQHGAVFRTRGDTEVILEAYKFWGKDCIHKFNGMFAFALWDEAEQSLWITRDRMGEKPLFYTPVKGGLAWASELPALLLYAGQERTIDAKALGHYLMLGYSPGETTLADGVKRLPPAHMLSFKRSGEIKIERYWNLAEYYLNKRSFASFDAAADELRQRLDESVKQRLVSDVPLGAFLSGGIDSSSIVASMAQHLEPGRIKTFSIGFPEATFDETGYARQVAAHLGVSHKQDTLSNDPAFMIKALEVAALDPLADTSLFPMCKLAAFARQDVTVALSGDAGDELFAGYETYIADKMHAALSPLPAWLTQTLSRAAEKFIPARFHKVGLDYKLKGFLRGLALSGPRAHASWRNLFTPEEWNNLFTPAFKQEMDALDPFAPFERHFDEAAGAGFLDQRLYVDIKSWMVDDILVKVDRTTMAFGLESRAPFLDHTLVEFAAQLPKSYKLRGLTTKRILKASQKSRLPHNILYRSKKGFNAPISHWLLSELKDFAFTQLQSPDLQAFIAPKAIDTLWKDHQNMNKDNGFKLLSLLCLSLWLKNTRSLNN